MTTGFFKCGREDSNLHGINSHQALNLTRLPIPPRPRVAINRKEYNRISALGKGVFKDFSNKIQRESTRVKKTYDMAIFMLDAGIDFGDNSYNRTGARRPQTAASPQADFKTVN